MLLHFHNTSLSPLLKWSTCRALGLVGPKTPGSPFLSQPEVAGWAEAKPGKGAEVMDAHVLVV